jgi:hypothetical protein
MRFNMGKGKRKKDEVVQTENYLIDVDFFEKCEKIASQLELTVDYLLDEFYIDDDLRMDSIIVNIY